MEYQYIEKIKEAIGITGNYQDGTLKIYIGEIIEEMVDSGVSREVAMSEKAIGAVAIGVNDIWTNTSGKVAHSPYFRERCIKLSYEKETEAEEENRKYKELAEELLKRIEENGQIGGSI